MTFLINIGTSKPFKFSCLLTVPLQVNDNFQLGIRFSVKQLSWKMSSIFESASAVTSESPLQTFPKFERWWASFRGKRFDPRYRKQGWKTTLAFQQARQKLGLRCLSHLRGYHGLNFEIGTVKGGDDVCPVCWRVCYHVRLHFCENA